MRRIHRAISAMLILAALGCTGGHGPRLDLDLATTLDPSPPQVRLPDDVRPVRMTVELTIDPADTTFDGHVRIDAEVRKSTGVVWLNATSLSIEGATVGTETARLVPGGDDFIGLAVAKPLALGITTIDIRYRGTIDREKSRGIYSQLEGKDWYAYTFFEPLDARRAFPCFDQPDAKIPWRLTFHVPRGQVALANAPVESESDEANGMKGVVMAESKPLPSYLVAFVVGPFEVVDGGTGGRASTPIRFVVPRGRSPELRYAREITPKVVSALEDYFDMPYPYGKLDVAVVPRFWGTMEHPGIVAMGQPLTLIAPTEETRDRRQDYANILAHELSHYWFGDLVTLAWWDDTWLNESLAQWLDVIITDRAEPSWRFADRRPGRSVWAMNADELLSTKAIRQPVESKEAIQASFDGSVTYEKGQAVAHMFESWVGAERWRDFVRAYVRKFAWRNASASDFFTTLDSSLGPEVAPAYRTFLEQPGVPVVEHRLACDGKPRLELSQHRALPMGATEDAARTWRLPVCVRYGGAREEHASCALLEAQRGAIALDGACPSWVVMNAGGTGYYRSRYGRNEIAALLGAGAVKTSMAERRMLIADVRASVSRGELPIGHAMGLVPTVLADPDERIQREASGLSGALRADVLDEPTLTRYRDWVRRTYGPLAHRLGWRRGAEDSDDRQELRARLVSLVAWAGDPALGAAAGGLARAWLADAGAVEDDIVDPLLEAATRDGDSTLYDTVLAKARTETDRTKQDRLLRALGGFVDPLLVERALNLVLADDFDLRESQGILAEILYRRETREQGWRFVRDHVDNILGRMRSDEASWFVGDAGRYFCDDQHREEVSALFSPRVSRIQGADYQLRQSLDEIRRCTITQARLAPDLATYLGAQHL